MAKAAKKSDIEEIESIGCPLVPSAVKYAFKHAPPVQSEEQLLWRLIAARAVLDVVGMTGFGPASQPKKHLNAVIDAQQWFRYEWDYARLVFDRAGVEIEGVREAMSEFHLDDENHVVRIPKEARRATEVHKTERSRAGAC